MQKQQVGPEGWQMQDTRRSGVTALLKE